MRLMPILPIVCLTLLGSATLHAQKVVVLHDDDNGTNTWTLAKQLGRLTPASGELLVVHRDSTEGPAAMQDADLVLDVRHSGDPGDSWAQVGLPEVHVSNPEAARAHLVSVFGDDIASRITSHAEAQASANGQQVIRLTYQAAETSRSYVNRWNRELAVALMLDLGMLAEHPGTASFLPSDGRVAFALYDGLGVTNDGPPRIERVVNGMGDDAYLMHICSEDVHDGILSANVFHAAVFPGGGGNGIARALEESGREIVTEYIERGGGYIGICAGAYLATAGVDSYLGIIGARFGQPWQKGAGTVEVELSEGGKAILGDEFAAFQARYLNGPILMQAGSPVPEGDFPEMEVWAWFRSAVMNPEGELSAEMIDTPAIVTSTHGEGRVLLIIPHPETHEELDPMMHRAFQWTVGG